MKKQLLVFLMIAFTIGVFAQKKQLILTAQETKLEVKSSVPGQLVLQSSVKDIKAKPEFIESKGNFTTLEAKDMLKSNKTGKPDLPTISKLIEVPYNAEIEITISGFNEEIIDLNSYGLGKIMPSQPSYSKSTNPLDMIFTMDEEYYQFDGFHETPLAQSEIIGIMRGTRIGRIEICPFHYNPVQNLLKVYNNLVIDIKFKNADFALTESTKNKYYSPEFEPSMQMLLNYKAPVAKDAFSNYNAPVKYVIVANSAFATTLAPFIEWKRKSGFNVIEAYTDVIGSTNTAIKTYLQGLYTAATTNDPAPLYVLIIGDHSGTYSIPAFASQNTGSGDSDHITDVYFATYDGSSDYLPDLYYGRISAESTTELSNALNKILPYEEYTIPDGTYLDNAMVIAGVDATYAHSHGDATILYAVNNYVNTSHDLTNIWAYYYNYSTGPGYVMSSNSSSAESDIISKINTGLGFGNYTAHCDHDGWSDPAIRRADIANFNNTNEYPFLIGNCCLSFQFNQSDAFGEMLLYTANEGAVGYIGTTNYSYWDEDVYWGIGVTSLAITSTNFASHTYANTGLGVYDGVYHENGEAYADWNYSARQIAHKGNLAVTASTSGFKQYYWEIYHCVGDPSLMPYMQTPPALSLTFTTPPAGATSLDVNTEDYTYVAISQNGTLLDAKWSGPGTSVTLNFSALDGSNVTIVGTKQNRAPYINENITPINSTTPPVCDFTADQTTVIQGTTINFTDLSAEYPTTWAWDFGGGGTPNTSNVKNPSIAFNTPGTYTVSLAVTNGAGSDSEAKTNYITVNAISTPPVADFIASQTNITTGESVDFTDLTTLMPTSWEWTFDGGTPGSSTLQNPAGIVYNTAGVYTVTLTATNSIGSDTETKTGYIIVNECQNVTLSIITDNYGSETTWNLVDDSGTTIASGGPYTDGSSQTVAQSWCLDVDCYTFTINDAYGDGICCSFGNGSYTLTNDETSEVYASGGAFSSTESTNFCVISTTIPPVAAFTQDVTSTCSGEVNFTDASTGVVDNWLWNFGDGTTSTEENPSHTYTAEGTFTVTLTVTNSYGSDINTQTDLITVDMPDVPVVTNNGVCGSGVVTLDATAAGTIEWYDAANGGNLVATGTTFTTPSLSSTTTYYVQNVVETYEASQFVPSPDITTSATYNTNRYVTFDVTAPLKLVSVNVKASTAGNRTVELRDNSGTVLQSTTANLIVGVNNITLNYEIQAGTGYRLGLASTSTINLSRHTTGLAYPYQISGLISITGTSTGTSSYYYYYNWEIQPLGDCASPRVPAVASVYSAPVLTMTSTNESSAGAFNGTATVTPNGISPFTYLWSPNVQTTQSITGQTAGTYCVTVTDVHGCQSNNCVTIEVGVTPLSATINSSVNVLCFNSCTGEATVLGSGGVAPYTYNWTSGSTGQTATGLCAGIYNVTVTDATSGTTTATVTITQPLAALYVTLSKTDVTCFGGNDGSITINASGGVSPYTYTWSNGTSAVFVSGLAIGNYSITVTDNNGCSQIVSETITQPTQLIVDITTNQADATANASGGVTPYLYLWSSGENASTITATANGTYAVSVTDAYGCLATGSVNIIIDNVDGIENNSFSIYPNPTSGKLNIEFSGSNAEMIYVTDVTGRKLTEQVMTGHKTILDLNSLDSGIYFINLKSETSIYTRTIVVTR